MVRIVVIWEKYDDDAGEYIELDPATDVFEGATEYKIYSGDEFLTSVKGTICTINGLEPEIEKLTDEDFKKMKFNESMNHVDFMIGSEDLDIVGTKFDGKKVQIFKNGNWAI